jgi:hypothetical protein
VLGRRVSRRGSQRPPATIGNRAPVRVLDCPPSVTLVRRGLALGRPDRPCVRRAVVARCVPDLIADLADRYRVSRLHPRPLPPGLAGLSDPSQQDQSSTTALLIQHKSALFIVFLLEGEPCLN